MIRHFLTLALLCGGIALSAQTTDPQVTSWVLNTTSVTGYGGILSNVQTVQYSGSQVYVSCSSVPSYSIGPWSSNPNVPSNQNLTHKFTRTPAQNTGSPVYTGLGQIGLWSNGVEIFNPKDGYYWNNSTSAFANGTTNNGWNRNAQYYEGISFDACLGHPNQLGAYHNHVNPTCLYNSTNTSVHSPIIGYSFDGYPVYGAFAYTFTNGTGPIKRMTPSYVLASSTGSVLLGSNTAPAATSSTASTTRNSGPAVNSTYPLGCMCEDYIYVPGAGDLDSHNGRFCITPEYPSGTYAYFVTIDASGNPVYPFVIGPTYYGTVQTGNTGPGGGHVTITEATTVYSGTPIPTAIKEPETIRFQLLPNPTYDFLFVYMDNKSLNNVAFALYDEQGKLLQNQSYFQPSNAYSIDMRNYPGGIYYAVLFSGGQRVKQKIIKAE